MSSCISGEGEVSDEEFAPFLNDFPTHSHLRSRSNDSQNDKPPYFAAMRPNKKRFADANDLPWIYPICFFALSFGYMCAWTSFGSLISYYKHQFGPKFYTIIYCAYYLPGLPVCLLQYKYDTFFDVKYGSQHTFLLRGVLYISSMVLVIVGMILLKSRLLLILSFSMLGICSWAAHGTASTLAALYPSVCIGALQTGFRSPELFVVYLTIYLHIGANPEDVHLAQFYFLTATGVAVGMLSWIILCTNKRAEFYFSEIDKEYHKVYTSKGASGVGDSSTKLMGTILDSLFSGSSRSAMDGAGEEEVGFLERGGGNSGTIIYSRYRYVDNDYYVEKAPLLGAIAERGFPRYSDNSGTCGYGTDSRTPILHDVEPVAKNPPPPAEDDDNSSTGGKILSSLSSLSRGEIDLPAFILDNIDREADIQPLSYSLIAVRHDVELLCNTLFVTMFTSIFQGAFFVFAKSAGGVNIEQYLYFTRLFSDLLGRPLASLPRPWFVQTDKLLWNGTLLRLLLLLAYFIYIFTPSRLLPRNDVAVCVVVGLFSVVNGYFSVLIYEYAAKRVEDKGKNAQAYATTLLNVTFQVSSVFAVILSVLIVEVIIPATGYRVE